ncbi:MAG: DDE-type integrase/transposase/recombinase [Thermocrispum sp.]
MTVSETEAAARAARARQIALFRYALIRPAVDVGLTSRQRGALVRALAAQSHTGPDGTPVRVSRKTLDRWIRAWRAGGFDALIPAPRQVAPRTDATVLELAVGLKKENPARTATQVARILRAQLGWSPSERTLQRHFASLELTTRPDGQPPAAFGRFEAGRINEIWVADVLHGPKISGHKSYLFAILDDHSRLVVAAKFCYREDTIRWAGVLRSALQSRGLPATLYLDNGAPFSDTWLVTACAKLGIQLTHSAPGRPQGRGKIERLFRTVREQFLVEITGAGEDQADGARRMVGDIDELNRLFTAWVETEYHRRMHEETGATPLQRYGAAEAVPLPSAALLAEAFRWGEYRTVRKTATVELHGNTYRVDPFLVGRKVELTFDPFDLTEITVCWQGKPVGTAVPHVIGRHAHPKARPELPDAEQPALTGIDYLALVEATHTSEITQRLRLSDLDTEPAEADALGDPDQLTIHDALNDPASEKEPA